MLGTTLSAVAVRGVSAAERADCAAAPRPLKSVPTTWRTTGQPSNASRALPATDLPAPFTSATLVEFPAAGKDTPSQVPETWGDGGCYGWVGVCEASTVASVRMAP